MSHKIRKAHTKDAKELIEYMNKAIEETKFLSFAKEDFNMTLEEEISFLEDIENSKSDCMLICEIDGKIAGTLHLEGKKHRRKHIAVLGISVLKEYWSKGLGSILMKSAIEEAKNIGFTKIELLVRIANERAVNLYKKYGFEIEGNIRNDIYMDEKYYDSYLMGLIL